MTPDEFLRSFEQKGPAPAYLFVGPEAYARDRCRRSLIERVLRPESREGGFTRHDLDEVDLSQVVDDASSFSLFSSERLIWVSSAESALPKGRAVASHKEDNDDGFGQLKRYLDNPVPGVVIVFDCGRYEFEGDDKPKLQRVQKFYANLPQVEFQRFSPGAARKLASELARKCKLQIEEPELDLLVDLLGSDASRIANEIEKLALYAGGDRRITEEDIQALSPSAKASTIFSLVAALGRNNRTAALESLDALVRDGEYLPLALSFIGTQFRLALVTKETKLGNPAQIQAYFSRLGTPMWRSRAEQVSQTANAFSEAKLRTALVQIYETDKALRDTRPDDRTVMESFILNLTQR